MPNLPIGWGGRAPNTWRGSLAAALLFCGAAHTPAAYCQSLSAVINEIRELTEHLANLSVDGTGDAYALATYGAKSLGPDVAYDAIIRKLEALSEDGRVKNLRGHLEEAFADGETARKLVDSINADLVEAPDYAHLNYCTQIDASNKKIKRIEVQIANLKKIASVAVSYKRALVSMDKMTTVVRQGFELLMSSLNTDGFSEVATTGTVWEQWDFFSNEPGVGSPGDHNAARLLSDARVDWDYVERTARAKVEQLTQVLQFRKAYHEHFYAATAGKCASSRGAHPEATRSTDSAPRPATGQGRPAECALLDDMRESNDMMQQDQAAWLALVGRCTGQ
jgi:hypothetical protein